VIYEKGRDHTEVDVSEHIALLEHKQQLLFTIEQLGEACQKILILFYFEEMPVKEILKHLHYENEQVVRNKKHKCLQQLAGLIKSKQVISNPIKSKEKK
jgi:DNA-directed RNA polymerase specialized sigma subunit